MHVLERVRVLEFLAHQEGQFQVIKEEVQELFLGDLEDELVHALALVAGLALAAAAALAAGRLGQAVAGHELLVAGVHHFAVAAGAMVEDRLLKVLVRDTDLLALLHVGDGAVVNGLRYRLLDVLAVTAQEPVTVHRALVLAVQATVNNMTHSHADTC